MFATASAASEAAAGCASEPDDRRRLQCYDRVFEHSETLAVARPASETTGTSTAEPEPELGRAGSIMSKTWELGQNDKRESFVVRTYLPKFLLPVHYTSNINRSPSSPTQ
ncbi:MAG: hypothetical protein Q8R95_05945, partial [Azonexus sp.]|nr:hypothetical protein [Azonexus sp.]